MKHRIFMIFLLATVIIGLNITQVNAKNAAEKCANSSDCETYCTSTKGYTSPFGDNEIINYTMTISRYKNEGKWVLYVTSDNPKVAPLIESDSKWSDIFKDKDKIRTGDRVYIKGITEEEMTNKLCPQHFYVRAEEASGNTWKITGVCLDNDNRACSKIDSNWHAISAPHNGFDDSEDYMYVVSENGEEVSRYEQEKVKIKEPDIHSGDEGCSGLFGDVITNDINTALKYIKYLGPVLVIVLSMMDFIKAVASGNNDEFTNAWKRLLTRLILAILLFFVVDLVKVIFNIFGITTPESCLK